MRLAYIVESLSLAGGTERIIADKMNYLADHGVCEVVCIEIYDYGKESPFSLSDKIERVCLGVRKTPQKMLKPLMFARVFSRLRHAVSIIKPDIISSQNLIGLIIFSLMRFDCHTIYESHSPRHALILRFLIPLLEKNVEKIVTLTHGDASEYHSNRVCVIPNFTSMPLAMPHEDAAKRAIFAGRLVKGKGIEDLIEAWHRIEIMCKEDDASLLTSFGTQDNESFHLEEWYLDIFGDGPMKEELESLIASYGLQSNITIHPATRTLQEELLNSSIFVMASESEGFPMVLLEAVTSGLPSVVYDCDYGPKEMVEDNKNGFLVPLYNIETFSGCILQLMKDKSLRQQFSSNCHEMIAEYSRENVMKKWITLFNSIDKEAL